MIYTLKRFLIMSFILLLLLTPFTFGSSTDILSKSYNLLFKNRQVPTETLLYKGEVYIKLSDLATTLNLSTKFSENTINFTNTEASVEFVMDEDNNLYTGSLVNGTPNGYGTSYLKEGGKYQGNWKNGLYEGQGTLVFPNGNIYIGNFSKGFIHGQGKMFYPDNSYYNGSYQYGIQEGFGLLYIDKDNKYEGYWSNGLRNGKGKAYINGRYKKGLWENNKLIKTLSESSFDF